MRCISVLCLMVALFFLSPLPDHIASKIDERRLRDL